MTILQDFIFTLKQIVSVAHYGMLWIPLKEVKERIPCHAEKCVYLFFISLDVLVEQIAKYKEQFVQAVQEVGLHFLSVNCHREIICVHVSM